MDPSTTKKKQFITKNDLPDKKFNPAGQHSSTFDIINVRYYYSHHASKLRTPAHVLTSQACNKSWGSSPPDDVCDIPFHENKCGQ